MFIFFRLVEAETEQADDRLSQALSASIVQFGLVGQCNLSSICLGTESNLPEGQLIDSGQHITDVGFLSIERLWLVLTYLQLTVDVIVQVLQEVHHV